MDRDEQQLGGRLTLRSLNMLLTVTKCGSMGKAAARLSASQPAIPRIRSPRSWPSDVGTERN